MFGDIDFYIILKKNTNVRGS